MNFNISENKLNIYAMMIVPYGIKFIGGVEMFLVHQPEIPISSHLCAKFDDGCWKTEKEKVIKFLYRIFIRIFKF